VELTAFLQCSHPLAVFRGPTSKGERRQGEGNGELKGREKGGKKQEGREKCKSVIFLAKIKLQTFIDRGMFQ